MAGGGIQRQDVRAQQPRLAVFHQYIGIGQVSFTHTQTFDFPATERHASFERIRQLIVKTGTPIAGDDVAGCFGFLFGHGAHYTEKANRGKRILIFSGLSGWLGYGTLSQ